MPANTTPAPKNRHPGEGRDPETPLDAGQHQAGMTERAKAGRQKRRWMPANTMPA